MLYPLHPRHRDRLHIRRHLIYTSCLDDPLPRRIVAMIKITEDAKATKSYLEVDWSSIRGTAKMAAADIPRLYGTLWQYLKTQPLL